MKESLSLKWTTLVVILASSMLFACKKDTKKASPAPAVMSVDWFGPSVNGGSEWKELAGVLGKELFIENFNNEITQGVLENSVILIYAKLVGYDPSIWSADHIALLPMQLSYKKDGIKMTDDWYAEFKPGMVRVVMRNSADLYTKYQICTESRFRCVIIPKSGARANGNADQIQQGGIMAQFSESDLRSMNYDQVCKITGLKR
jgi:hypothetical protein